MANKRDAKALANCVDSAEVAKQRLIEVEDDLRTAGYNVFADKMSAIIITLEILQNKMNRR